jgi:hypothetical protein
MALVEMQRFIPVLFYRKTPAERKQISSSSLASWAASRFARYRFRGARQVSIRIGHVLHFTRADLLWRYPLPPIDQLSSANVSPGRSVMHQEET